MLVGHQPTLGELASQLLGASMEDWPIKKGALLWLAEREQADGARAVLLAAMTPDLV